MDDTFFDGHDKLYHHAKFGEDRTTRAGCRCKNVVCFFCFVFLFVFRLDALVLSVIATATWLAGWLAGWLSHSGIVSKPVNLSEKLFRPSESPITLVF